MKVADIVDTFLEEEASHVGDDDLGIAVAKVLATYQRAGAQALEEKTMRDLVEELS